MVVIYAGEGFASRKNTYVINQRQGPPETPTGVGAQHHCLDRSVLQSQTRGELQTFSAKQIGSQSKNSGKLVIITEGVLPSQSYNIII